MPSGRGFPLRSRLLGSGECRELPDPAGAVKNKFDASQNAFGGRIICFHKAFLLAYVGLASINRL